MPIQCPDLSIENGKVIILPTNRSVNSSAEYSCNGGYKLDKGDAKRTCQVDGTWSGTDPECSKCSKLCTSMLHVDLGHAADLKLLNTTRYIP